MRHYSQKCIQLLKLSWENIHEIDKLSLAEIEKVALTFILLRDMSL